MPRAGFEPMISVFEQSNPMRALDLSNFTVQSLRQFLHVTRRYRPITTGVEASSLSKVRMNKESILSP
jgi:hypothetical protein